MLTNVMGLPEAVVRAVANDPYTYGKAHISATSLYGAPRPRILRRRHADEIVEDVGDRLWALVGQIGHGILERAIYTRNAHEVLEAVVTVLEQEGASNRYKVELISELLTKYIAQTQEGDITERRLFGEWGGWTVSGQLDIFRGILTKIQDYKFTSVMTMLYGGRTEWTYQLNTYAGLGRKNGIVADALEIIAIFRDWKKSEAKADPSYPQSQVMVVPIELWTPERTDAWIEERVRVHQLAELTERDDDLPFCTDDERWIRSSTSWAVMKDGQERAVAAKGIETEQDALDFIAEKEKAGKAAGLRAVERVFPGKPTRCLDYCNVSHLCNQWKNDYRSFAGASSQAH